MTRYSLRYIALIERSLLIVGRHVDISKNLQALLSKKYFWRNWYVIAYKKQTSQNSFSRLCGEDSIYMKILNWKSSLDIIIFSTRKDEPSKKFDGILNKYAPASDLQKVRYDKATWEHDVRTAPAKSIYQLLSTKARSCLYPLVLVVKDGVDVAMQVPNNRVFVHTYWARILDMKKRGHKYEMKQKKINQVYIIG